MVDLTKLRPDRITAAIPLMAFSSMLVTIVVLYTNISGFQKTLLGCSILAAVVLTIFLSFSSGGGRAKTDGGIVDTPLRELIDSSGLPMYVLGSDLRIKHCNSRMYELLGVGEEELLGQHVKNLIDAIARLIPDDADRVRFLKEQDEFLKGHRLPPPGAETKVLIDRRLLTGDGPNRGKVEIRIYSDAIGSPKFENASGAFITYRVVPRR